MNKRNKKLYPAWRPIPDNERYPHTHYGKELNLSWVYQTIGILKSWCMTLTHFIAKLAKLHNEDIENLIEEMKTLLDKINSWINTLTSALESYAIAEKNFQSQAIYQAESLTLLTETIYNAINKISPLLIEVLQCIETTLDEHSKEIDNIETTLDEQSGKIDNIETELKDINSKLKDIDNIEKRLNEIESYIDQIFEILAELISNTMSSTILTYGSDYTITFYNGFQPDAEEGLTVAEVPRVTETITELKAPDKTYYTATVKLSCNSNYILTNSNIITPDVEGTPLFSHGKGYEEVPESRIFQITFLNDLYNKNTSNYSQVGNEIWNMTPRRARASWAVMVNASNVEAGKVILYAASIADGYNQQYYSRYDEELSFGDLNLNMELNYSYSS